MLDEKPVLRRAAEQGDLPAALRAHRPAGFVEVRKTRSNKKTIYAARRPFWRCKAKKGAELTGGFHKKTKRKKRPRVRGRFFAELPGIAGEGNAEQRFLQARPRFLFCGRLGLFFIFLRARAEGGNKQIFADGEAQW